MTPTPPAAAAATPAPQQPIALPGASEIAARNNPLPKSSPEDAAKPESMTSAPAEKEKSIATASDSKYDHLSAPASAIVSGTATPAEKKEEEEPQKETATAEEKSSKYDHLSVPASAVQSGTATPAEPVAVKTEAEEEKPNTSEEVKKVEGNTAVSEEETAASTEDVESATKGVEGMQVGEGKTVGQQEAKKPEDAVKSVED